MSRARRCLVIHPGALGDVLAALPALRHLSALGFERALASAPRIGALLVQCGAVESAVDLDGLGLHRLFAGSPEASALRALAPYNAVVSWLGAGEPLYRASLDRLGVPVVVARAAPAPGVRLAVSAHLLETLAGLGPRPPSGPVAPLAPPGPARARAEAWLRARGLGVGDPVVVQAGAGSPAKVWPGFPGLARRLVCAGTPVAVVAGPADAGALAAFVATGAVDGELVARDLPLDELAALAALARIFVGNDSGPTHLAAAVGCPTLALFGPSDPAVWAPVGARVRVLAGPGAGAPDPWAGLDVDRVLAALASMVGPGATLASSPA